jgi:uncharacterized protein (TIGR02594 family)
MMNALFKVVALGLNLREQDTAQSQSYAILSKDEELELVGVSERAHGYWLKVKYLKTGQVGWVSRKYVRPITAYAWATIAFAEYGQEEITGQQDNQRIVQYLRSTTFPIDSYADQDSIHWCAGFVNWCIEAAGFAGADSARALDWSTWGKELASPHPGCVAVFRRSGGGHVAFYMGEDSDNILVLGGNQGIPGEVNISTYDKNRVVAFRTL